MIDVEIRKISLTGGYWGLRLHLPEGPIVAYMECKKLFDLMGYTERFKSRLYYTFTPLYITLFIQRG